MTNVIVVYITLIKTLYKKRLPMFKTAKNVFLLIITLALFCVSLSSMAKDLTQSNVGSFISAMDDLRNTNDPALKALNDKTQFNPKKSISVSKEGQLNVYQNAIQQEIPNDSRTALKNLAKNNGFSSLEQWAQISDRIIAAYLQVNLDKQGGLNKIPELTPQIRQALPPEMLAQIEQINKMAKEVGNAPAKDVALVKANYAQIEQLLK